MENENRENRIGYLVHVYNNRKITAEEAVELLAWRDEREDNRIFFETRLKPEAIIQNCLIALDRDDEAIDKNFLYLQRISEIRSGRMEDRWLVPTWYMWCSMKIHDIRNKIRKWIC